MDSRDNCRRADQARFGFIAKAECGHHGARETNVAKGGRKGAHEAPRAPQIAPGRAIFGNRLALAPNTRCPGRLFLAVGYFCLGLLAGILLRAVTALVSRNVFLKAFMAPSRSRPA